MTNKKLKKQNVIHVGKSWFTFKFWEYIWINDQTLRILETPSQEKNKFSVSLEERWFASYICKAMYYS